MAKKDKKNNSFFGTTTIGKKGQLIIPVQARQTVDLRAGEKLLVFGLGADVLALTKFSKFKKIASRLAGRLGVIQEMIN